jgi:hypothetical protein
VSVVVQPTALADRLADPVKAATHIAVVLAQHLLTVQHALKHGRDQIKAHTAALGATGVFVTRWIARIYLGSAEAKARFTRSHYVVKD